MNIIDESGLLAISTRLHRLADQIRKEGALVYKANGVDFEPKWFPVIYALHIKSVLSVVELAAEINYTHPSTIALLKELEKEKLVRSKRDKNDERKRLLQLTEKGKKLVSNMLPVWDIIIAAITEITDTPNNLMKAINETERNLAEKSFPERAKKYMV